MQLDVLCIGHAAYDVSVFVDGFPQENSKCETHELLEVCGGPAANAAYLLSLWGLRCAFAGLAGDDGYGRRIRDEFQSVGTDVSLLELREGHATPLSLILINRFNGSRTIVNRKAQSSTFQCRALGAWTLDSALECRATPRILLFDGHELEASLAAFPDAVSILFEAARQAGLQVSLDLNWDPQWGRASAAQIKTRKQAARDVLPLVNLAHGNARELMEFTLCGSVGRDPAQRIQITQPPAQLLERLPATNDASSKYARLEGRLTLIPPQATDLTFSLPRRLSPGTTGAALTN